MGNGDLIGDAGKDVFLFNTALNGTANVDLLDDFNVADDTIRLDNAIFTALVGTGTLTAVQIVKNASGTAGQADDRIVYGSDTGNVFYDSNGSATGGRVLFANATDRIQFLCNLFGRIGAELGATPLQTSC